MIVKKEEEFRELYKNEYLDLNQIKLLIQTGIDVNGRENEGMNALHLFCSHNPSEKLTDAIQVLIQKKIDVNEETDDGVNAFHLLCQFVLSQKIIDAFQLLIENGIQFNGGYDI